MILFFIITFQKGHKHAESQHSGSPHFSVVVFLIIAELHPFMLIYMGPYYGYQANGLDKHGNAYYEK